MAANPFTHILGNREIQDIFFWQTLGAILDAALAPEIAALQQESFKLTPTLILGAAELADAVVRGHLDLATARDQARQGGLSAENFQVLLDGSGQPPDFLTLAEAWRRGIIEQAGKGGESTSLEQGIRESRLKDKWIPVLERLQYRLPDPGVLIEGWLRAQITEANARELLRQNGIDPATQTLMYQAAGRPPGAQELQDLFHRGLIPHDGTGPGVLSLEQGFKETDLKDKWWPVWQRLGEYIPPPRTVTAMVREGALSDEQALAFFKASGLPESLAAAYLAAAHKTKVAADHELAKSDVLTLYFDLLWGREQAAAALHGLGYSAENAAFLLDYTDFRREKALLDKAVAKVYSLYVGHKIQKPDAVATLDSLGLAAAQRDHLLLTWDQERQINVKLLTPAEIAAAASKGLMPVAEAWQELQDQGYTARDAGLFLQIHGLALPGAASGP